MKTIYKLWVELERCEVDEDGVPENGCETLGDAEVVAEFETEEAARQFAASIPRQF